jgi:hypothetical protein
MRNGSVCVLIALLMASNSVCAQQASVEQE